VHEHLPRVQAGAVDLEPVAYRAATAGTAGRCARSASAGVDDVGLAEVVEVVAHAAPERLHVARDERRRAGDRDVRAHAAEGEDVRARDAAVQDVADDPDVLAVEVAELAHQRVDVEQRLGRMLVLAVAGVDDARPAPAGDEVGAARPRRAADDRVGLVRAQRQDGVLERLALLDARAARAEVHDVGAQALGRQLEARAGAGARPRRRG
jgi:hypothetical protein